MKTMTLAETLRDLLTTNIVCFTYLKVNGEIRQAKGTRNIALAEMCLGESIAKPKTDRVNENAYFDLEKGAWRSYVPEKLISINSIEIKGEMVTFNKMVKEVYGNEKPKTPKPTIEKGIGGLPFGFGDGMAMPKGEEEIRKALKEMGGIELPLSKEPNPIVVGIPTTPMGGKGVVFPPKEVAKEHTALPIDGMSIEDFAKLVAHYVVEELVTRITR